MVRDPVRDLFTWLSYDIYRYLLSDRSLIRHLWDVLKYIFQYRNQRSLCSNKYPAKIIFIGHFENFLLLLIFKIKLIQNFFYMNTEHFQDYYLCILNFFFLMWSFSLQTILKEANIKDYNGLNSKHAAWRYMLLYIT